MPKSAVLKEISPLEITLSSSEINSSKFMDLHQQDKANVCVDFYKNIFTRGSNRSRKSKKFYNEDFDQQSTISTYEYLHKCMTSDVLDPLFPQQEEFNYLSTNLIYKTKTEIEKNLYFKLFNEDLLPFTPRQLSESGGMISITENEDIDISGGFQFQMLDNKVKLLSNCDCVLSELAEKFSTQWKPSIENRQKSAPNDNGIKPSNIGTLSSKNQLPEMNVRPIESSLLPIQFYLTADFDNKPKPKTNLDRPSLTEELGKKKVVMCVNVPDDELNLPLGYSNISPYHNNEHSQQENLDTVHTFNASDLVPTELDNSILPESFYGEGNSLHVNLIRVPPDLDIKDSFSAPPGVKMGLLDLFGPQRNHDLFVESKTKKTFVNDAPIGTLRVEQCYRQSEMDDYIEKVYVEPKSLDLENAESNKIKINSESEGIEYDNSRTLETNEVIKYVGSNSPTHDNEENSQNETMSKSDGLNLKSTDQNEQSKSFCKFCTSDKDNSDDVNTPQ